MTVTTVTQFLSTIFRHAYRPAAHANILGGHYCFLLASDSVHPYRQKVDWARFRMKGFAESLQYYSPEIHVGAFALPNRIGGSSRIRLEDLRNSLGNSSV